MNEASRKPCAWAAVLLVVAWGDSGWSVEMLTASAVRKGKERNQEHRVQRKDPEPG